LPSDPWEALKSWLDEMVEAVKKAFIVAATYIQRKKMEETRK